MPQRFVICSFLHTNIINKCAHLVFKIISFHFKNYLQFERKHYSVNIVYSMCQQKKTIQSVKFRNYWNCKKIPRMWKWMTDISMKNPLFIKSAMDKAYIVQRDLESATDMSTSVHTFRHLRFPVHLTMISMVLMLIYIFYCLQHGGLVARDFKMLTCLNGY